MQPEAGTPRAFGKQCTGWFDRKTRHGQGLSSGESDLVIGCLYIFEDIKCF